MLLGVLVSHIADNGVRAQPLSRSVPDVSLSQAASQCDDPYQCRTVWNIIWSSFATILACTWIALHLNIPGPEEKWQVPLGRVGIMILALIAPELVVMWAMRQWLVSRRIYREYRDYRWTQTHGFFVVMGGFVLWDDDRPCRVLQSGDLKHFLDKGAIKVTEGDIKDKSKGDALSKSLVTIQTAWFILQCIARGVQHLPVTELEVVTLGFATLNFATFWLWLDKPLSVRCPIPVYGNVTASVKDGHEGSQNEISGDRPGVLAGIATSPVNLKNGFTHIIQVVKELRAFDDLQVIFVHFRSIGTRISEANRRVVEQRPEIHLLDYILGTLFLFFALIWFPIMFTLGCMIDMGFGLSPDVESDAKKVPTFYSGRITAKEEDLAHLVFILSSAIFGTIHCIAWSFEFPTHDEQLLWRISSITITCTPPILLASYRGLRSELLEWRSIRTNWLRLTLRYSSRGVMEVLHLTLPIVYFAARLALLVEALVALRALPSGAYQTVRWTTFIPHI